MADFRKWILAFAVVALLLGASSANAQITSGGGSVTCNVNAGNPTIVRSEGITELVGDYVLQCTGGTPTPANTPIPLSNVTLTLNTNITSRLLGSGYIDALLVIDEAQPASGRNPSTTVFPAPAGAPPFENVCFSNTSGPGSIPANCNVFNGTNGVSPYSTLANTSVTPPIPQAFNVFVARQASANQITWLGVPIDAPGTTGVRVLRITNVRANACQLGTSSTLIPTQIVAFVSINGSQNIVVSNPQQTLAFIQPGLIVGGVSNTLQQCNNLNTGGGGLGGNFFSSSPSGSAVSGVTLTEGFAASWKRRIISNVPVGINGSTSEGPQNVPGFAYNTESGFAPTTVTTSSGPATTTQTTFGVADTATRFLLRFNNVGAGVRLVLPTTVPLVAVNSANTQGNPNPPSTGLGTWTGGFIRLVGGSSDVSGNLPSNTFGFVTSTTVFTTQTILQLNTGTNFFPAGFGSPFNAAAEITGTGGTIIAVYEVVNADPSAVESARIPVGVAFTSNTANNLPGLGISTVNASFAPLSTVATADGSAPIPRFCDTSTARNEFTINACTCNLLFPFVTNQAGFDTGIAIANTSVDPFGTVAQTGTVTLNYYGGTTGGGAAPAAQTSQTVPGGQELVFTLSNGGNLGVTATPGFQGYIIATTKFQFCHAFAFISDLGAQRLAEGYLAIQLDNYAGAGLNRTGNVGEVQGH